MPVTREQAVKLLPCPFCGGHAEHDSNSSFREYVSGKISRQVTIYCESCTASITVCIPDVPDITIEQVADMWNQRAKTRADIEAKVAELSEEIRARKANDGTQFAGLNGQIDRLVEQLSALEEEKRKLIEAVADHVTVRSEQHSRIVELEEEVAKLKVIEESALKVCGELDEIVLVMPYDYLDPQDGGNVPMSEQIKRMWSEVKILRENVSNNAELRQQLAASQLEVKGLRDALTLVRSIIVEAAQAGFNHNTGDWAGRLYQSQSATHQALSTSHDDTALREYCAGVVERFADGESWPAKANLKDYADMIRKGEAL